MVRVTSVLALFLALFVAVNTASAKGAKQTPADRFDAMEKSAKHDPLTGALTKDEFVAAFKELTPKKAEEADSTYDKITKADPSKVTKDEFVTYIKSTHKKKAS